MWYKILWEFREGRSNLWLGAREGFTEVVEFLVGIPVGWELGIACGRQKIYREEKSLEFKVERINYEDFPSGTVLKTLYFQCRVTGLIPCQRTIWAFPDSSVGKESAWNAGDPRLIRRLGRSAGEGIGYPLQYSWSSLADQLRICLQCVLKKKIFFKDKKERKLYQDKRWRKYRVNLRNSEYWRSVRYVYRIERSSAEEEVWDPIKNSLECHF